MELRTEHLTKRYGPFTVVDDVNVAIGAEERVCLVGPNGSGKTTLLRMLAGLTAPTSGTISLDGEAYRDAAVRRRLGFVAHESMLYEDLTVRENLSFHVKLRGLPATRVDEVLDVIDLGSRERSPVRELSHGMRKRLALAREEIDAPEILLLDEPFSGLDQRSTRTVIDRLEDRTVVLSTHDFETALEVSDRIVVLDRGAVRADIDDAATWDLDSFRTRYRDAIAK